MGLGVVNIKALQGNHEVAVVFFISRCEDRASERLAHVTEAIQLVNHDSDDLKMPRPGFSLPVVFRSLQPDYLPTGKVLPRGSGSH